MYRGKEKNTTQGNFAELTGSVEAIRNVGDYHGGIVGLCNFTL